MLNQLQYAFRMTIVVAAPTRSRTKHWPPLMAEAGLELRSVALVSGLGRRPDAAGSRDQQQPPQATTELDITSMFRQLMEGQQHLSSSHEQARIAFAGRLTNIESAIGEHAQEFSNIGSRLDHLEQLHQGFATSVSERAPARGARGAGGCSGRGGRAAAAPPQCHHPRHAHARRVGDYPATGRSFWVELRSQS